MSSRERKGGEGQEVVYFVTCRVHTYYLIRVRVITEIQTKDLFVQVGYE